ncbi:MAG: hypothetical protein NW200_10905 [Hyphomonadaceae bacterium]|nr:hypothetical protein [Hyphomonadaceae bacterium]
MVNPRERWDAIGVEEAAGAAFRRVAAARAPALARAHADLFAAAYAGVGAASLPPRWRAPWPQPWRDALTWRRTKTLAVAAVARVHPALGRTAEAVVRLGRVRAAARQTPQTQACRLGPPRVITTFDATSQSPLILAHELGHAAQMAVRPLGPSRPPPPMAAAELAAHVAERAFHAVYAEAGPPRAAAARMAEDLLAMLVRHPARDALEQTPEAWGQIAAGYAPGHAWSGDPPPLTPRAQAEPLSTLAYAMAATLATALFARMEGDARLRDAYLDWVRAGPDARFDEAVALMGARADDPGLYEAAYDVAVDDMRRVQRFA